MMLPFDINVEEESPHKNSLSSSGTSLARPPPAHSSSTPHPSSSSSVLSSSLPPPGNETPSSPIPDWSNMTAASFTSHCFISRNEFLGLNSSANFKEELSRLAEAFSAFNCAELLASVVKQNICDALCSRSLIIELFRYIALRTLIKGNTNSQVLAVPFIIDTVFQLLLRYPRSYYDLCAALLRTPNEVVEYTPFGLDNHTFQSRYSATLASYLHVFGAIPPRLFWPPPTTQQSYYKGRPLLNSRFSTPPPLYTPMILFNLNDANAKAAFSAPLLRVAQAIQAYDCGELRAYVIQESHCANLDFFSVMLEVFRYLALTALDMDFENLVPPYSVAKIWSIMLLFPQSYHALALRIFPDRRHIDPPAVYFKRGDESDEDLKAKYRCTLGKYLSLFYCRPSILMWPTLPLSLVKGLPAIDPPVPSSALSYSSKQPDGPSSSSSVPNSSLPISSTSLPAPAMVKFIIRDLKGVDASMSILPTSSLRRAFTIYAGWNLLKLSPFI